MGKKEIVLRHINRDGFGIEIGPGFNPIAPKSEGYKVHVIDHACREDLLKKYRSAGVELNKIEEVDFVWKGQTYAELTGKKHFYDWIIASHVIEHTPDFIGFINWCDEILTDRGVLTLVVPDKRFCFDHFRPLTGIGKIIDAHFSQHTIHTAGTVAECLLSSVTQSGQISWSQDATGDYAFFHTVEQAKATMNRVVDHGEMVDSHAWCFTPNSFRLMIADLNLMGFIKLHEIDFHSTSGCEFYVTLARREKSDGIARLEMLKQIENELLIDGSGGRRNLNPVPILKRWRKNYVKSCSSLLRNVRGYFY